MVLIPKHKYETVLQKTESESDNCGNNSTLTDNQDIEQKTKDVVVNKNQDWVAQRSIKT